MTRCLSWCPLPKFRYAIATEVDNLFSLINIHNFRKIKLENVYDEANISYLIFCRFLKKKVFGLIILLMLPVWKCDRDQVCRLLFYPLPRGSKR